MDLLLDNFESIRGLNQVNLVCTGGMAPPPLIRHWEREKMNEKSVYNDMRKAKNELWSVSEVRKWHEIAKKMPFMEIPEGYKIAVIPPFSAADARFWIKRPDERVISVYADFYDSLGCEGKPYWEVYPCVDGETGRCEIDDIKTLWEMIKWEK